MIFNIGFNKSGTTSLTEAMEILGYKSIHHRHGSDERVRKFINRNIESGKRLLEGFEEYEFFSDFGGQKFFKELDKQYPNSKFILTCRDMDDWLDSRMRHMIRNRNNPEYTGTWLSEDSDVSRYRREQEEIEIFDYFKNRNDLLILKICEGEGWNELCSFLDVEIPEVPFPWRNRKKGV
jgi:hypothetical protein